jgi:hypothetical protein
MPTTTNYGWTTPADTDLVKDGAAAIRTLGSSIDTTLKTQIDAQIPDALLTTKGDIIAATGASTPARLAVGTNNQVLVADSTAATGIKWATPAGALVSGQIRVDTSQSTSSSTYTALTTAQAVTVTTGTKVLVLVSTFIESAYNGSGTAYASFAISGATTRASDDTWCVSQRDGGASSPTGIQVTYASFQTVTAGSNTFTAQFKRSGTGSATFSNRQLIVIDLGS